MKRNRESSSKVGANADASVPRMNKARSRNASRVWDALAPRAAMVGAPTTTPNAYIVMSVPALAISVSGDSLNFGRRSRAMSGRRPMEANSVTPIPNPPRAMARRAMLRRVGVRVVKGDLPEWRGIDVSRSPCSSAD
jgi:hypothetical protein